jgi:S-adenosylmethionine uptake transporter
MTPAPRDNLKGGAWLIADMALNVWALSIVKALGLGYPAAQIVFLRALVGLVVILPWVVRRRADFRHVEDLPIHLLRVALSTVTLAASFFAISRVPLALFTAINFTRPLISMVMAALILREFIGPRRWIAAGVALVGVVIAVDPAGVGISPGLLALGVVVLTGSGAVIATRHLRSAPPVVMMAFYTGGLGLCTLPFALWSWTPVAAGEWLPLLLIGAFAQAAQFCFITAHYHGEAGFLSVLSYLSLPVSVGIGYAVFNEVPDGRFWLGAVLVVSAALWVTLRARRP